MDEIKDDIDYRLAKMVRDKLDAKTDKNNDEVNQFYELERKISNYEVAKGIIDRMKYDLKP